MSARIPEDDPRLDVENITYPGKTGEVMGHLAMPKGDEKLPGVIIIHENRGLNPHTEDVARRVALEGFIAIAPNALSPMGGTPDDSDEARSLMQTLDSGDTVANFVAAAKYLKTHPKSTGKVGVTGFCWGGGMTNYVAVNSPDVQAAVPFYGRQPVKEDVPQIKASILAHYAGDDERINAGIPEFKKALEEASIEHEVHMYEGAKHAFFNDTSTRYHEEAAKLAWERTIAFFNKKLK
jgi:carboxymethylenebutenolidase